MVLSTVILSSDDRLTKALLSRGICTWGEVTGWVRDLPYGRNSNRTDLSLVLSEERGTCSSKHAFLKKIADLNKVPGIDLVLGIFEMNASNFPKVADVLKKAGLIGIPEAHCYLKIGGVRYDYTSCSATVDGFSNSLFKELVIEPDQVIDFKVRYHQAFLKKWWAGHQNKYPHLKASDLWQIRENCIAKLAL